MKTAMPSAGWTKGLGIAALGAVAMYFFDPNQGRRRRAMARDTLRSTATKAGEAIDDTARDFGNRLTGTLVRVRHVPVLRGKAPDDRVLAERVRTRLGRTVSHPHAIAVAAHDGRIELSGPVLAHERRQLLDSVSAVAGVTGVTDLLDIHEKADGIPALQGEGRRIPVPSESRPDTWTPAQRSIAVASGTLLGTYGLTRRTPAGAALAIAGLALLARGAYDMPLQRMLGLGSATGGIQLKKTIDINVPVDTAFDVWTEYENFPYFMSHVVEVRDLGEQRSHWVVKGPAGIRLEWDAVLTDYKRPGLLSWETEPGAMVEHAGSVYFEPTDSGTRVTVRMSYRPPAGALGHALAAVLGSDPKRELDDDLLRMKSFIEGGIPPHDAAKPRAASGIESQAVQDDASIPASAFAAGSEGFTGDEDPARPVVSAASQASPQSNAQGKHDAPSRR